MFATATTADKLASATPGRLTALLSRRTHEPTQDYAGIPEISLDNARSECTVQS
jgi:hypothetical protein